MARIYRPPVPGLRGEGTQTRIRLGGTKKFSCSTAANLKNRKQRRSVTRPEEITLAGGITTLTGHVPSVTFLTCDASPPELWEGALPHLAPEQIFKLRTVLFWFLLSTSVDLSPYLQADRGFRDLIGGSPEMQYLIDFYVAGLKVGY